MPVKAKFATLEADHVFAVYELDTKRAEAVSEYTLPKSSTHTDLMVGVVAANPVEPSLRMSVVPLAVAKNTDGVGNFARERTG